MCVYGLYLCNYRLLTKNKEGIMMIKKLSNNFNENQ